MSSYAFFVHEQREDFKREHPNEEFVFEEFAKMCSDKWREMSEEDKKRYAQMADDEMHRLIATNYVPPQTSEDTLGEPPKVSDAPRRPLQAFHWFCNDERSKIKDTLPADATIDQLSVECARRWNDLSASDKVKYEALAEKDRARYNKEMAIYRKKAEEAESSDSDD